MDETLDYNQQFWMNSETNYNNINVYAVPAIQRNTGFNYRAHPPIVGDPASFAPLHRAPLLFVTQFDGSRFYPRLVGGTALENDTNGNAIAVLGDGAFSLLDATATLNTKTNTIEAKLVWHVDEPADVKLFLHITCDGVLIAQADGYPWGDLYPFSAWQSGDSRVDIRTIQLNENVSQDCLHVYTGLYTVEDVTRLAAVNPETEARLPDDAIPVPLEVVDSQ
jgi:hypothetical protein